MSTDELYDNVSLKLEECEATIERGLRTFVEVGQALAEIRDFRLYRFIYGTFEAYLHQRWDISKSRAYQMIDASRVTREMSTIVDALPATESQARELAGLDTEQAAQVMRETVDRVRGKVTAKAIRQTRERITSAEPATPAPPKAPKPQPVPDDHRYCDDGRFFTQQALAAWDEHPPTGKAAASDEFRWWFDTLLREHFLCIDPYLLAGLIASSLDSERRNANGPRVLAELAGCLGLFDYRLVKEARGIA